MTKNAKSSAMEILNKFKAEQPEEERVRVALETMVGRIKLSEENKKIAGKAISVRAISRLAEVKVDDLNRAKCKFPNARNLIISVMECFQSYDDASRLGLLEMENRLLKAQVNLLVTHHAVRMVRLRRAVHGDEEATLPYADEKPVHDKRNVKGVKASQLRSSTIFYRR